MATPKPVIPSSLRNSLDPDEWLLQFDQAWRGDAPPAIEAFVPAHVGANPAGRRRFLGELIKIDLEYRWRSHTRNGGSAAGAAPAGSIRPQPHLEDYVARFPELGRLDELPVELIGAEYWVRQHWGDQPPHAQYLARFPRHGAALRQELARVDGELAREFAQRGIARPAVGAAAVLDSGAPRPAVSAAAFLQALQTHALLSAAQLDEVRKGVRGPWADLRALSRELLQRNWLTPYQVNLLCHGRGNELVLGPYLLLSRLGEGGTGQVFKARHRKMNRVTAVKLVRKDLLDDAEVVARFVREIEVSSQLAHPNVVHAYDAAIGASYFLAMEHVEGIDLGRLVKQSGPLSAARACDYVRQAALGLQHAHEKGLVHRDVKPSNLLLSNEGVVKILDLGLARLHRSGQHDLTLAATGSTGTLTPHDAIMMGTPDYLAPEQAVDFHGADIRADVYGLGCTLHFLLTGQPPFPGGTLAEKILKHQQTPPPSIERLRPGLPAALPAVLARMLAKRPEDRYQHPAEVAQALAPLANGSAADTTSVSLIASKAGSTSATQPMAMLAANQRVRRLPRLIRGRSRRVAASVAAIVVGTAVVASLVLLARPGRTPAPDEVAGASALDRLDGRGISTESDAVRWPEGTVAVLGDAPYRPWGTVRCVACSPDGELVATAGDDDVIRLWDAETRQLRRALRGHQKHVLALAFAPGGRVLASGDGAGSLRLWNVLTGQQWVVEEKAHTGAIRSLAFGDAPQLVTGGEDGIVRLWLVDVFPSQRLPVRVDLRKSPVVLTRLKGTVNSVAFAPGKPLVASAGEDGMVRLWNSATGQEQASFPGAAGKPVERMAFAHHGKTLVVCGGLHPDGMCKLWEVTDPKEVHSVAAPGYGPILAAAFAPDDKLVAFASSMHGSIRLFDPVTGKELPALSGDGWGGICSVDFLPGGHALVAGDHLGRVARWPVGRASDPSKPVAATPVFYGSRDAWGSVALAADGTVLASSDRGAAGVKLWDALSGRTTGAFDEHREIVTALVCSPLDDTVASADRNGEVFLWQSGTRRRLHRLSHGKPVHAVAFSPNGRMLAVAGGAEVSLWQVGSGQRQGQLNLPAGSSLAAVAFAPNGRLLATGDAEKMVRIWDLDTLKESAAAEMMTRNHSIASLSFLADAQTLAVGTPYGLQVWNLGKPTKRQDVACPGRVYFAALAKDKTLMGVSSEAAYVFEWDGAPGKLRRERRFPGPVNAAALAPDGRHLATANGNGTISILRLAPPPPHPAR